MHHSANQFRQRFRHHESRNVSTDLYRIIDVYNFVTPKSRWAETHFSMSKSSFREIVRCIDTRNNSPVRIFQKVFEQKPHLAKSVFDDGEYLACLQGLRLKLSTGLYIFAFRLKLKNGLYLIAHGKSFL